MGMRGLWRRALRRSRAWPTYARAAPGLAVLLACRDSNDVRKRVACSEDLAAENERLRRELAKLRAQQAPAAAVVSPPPALESTWEDTGLAKTLQQGPRVYIWGTRATIPVCEATGDKEPESHLRTPAEVHWFRLHAEKQGCLWHQLAFGPSFGVARTGDGDVFLWGSCKKEAGGRRFMEPMPLILDDMAPRARIRDVQCSESSVWGLTSDGEVVVWERVPDMIQAATGSKQRPLRAARVVDGFERPVRSMSIGPSHATFVLDDGEVYCIGDNRNGECAADPFVSPMVASSQRVNFPPGVTPVTKACSGRSHTGAISSHGKSWAWGDDSKIQLGLGDTRSNFGDERPFSGSAGYLRHLQTGESMAPAAVLRGGPEGAGFARAARSASAKYGEFAPHLQYKPVAMQDIPLEYSRQQFGIPYPPADEMVCGDDFTILVIRDSPDWFSPEEATNRLFCCGENGRGQCGRSMQTSQQTWGATRTPRNSRIEALSCGSSHCMAVLRRIGAGSHKPELWGWGSNDKGQTGGKQGWVCPAGRIRLPDHGMRIESAGCGFASSGVICSDRYPGDASNSLRKVDSVKTRKEDLED